MKRPQPCPGCKRLKSKIRKLEAQNKRLKQLLEEARRTGKRQAGPFSKGDPVEDPKPPGRKKGKVYGTPRRREIPKKIDEVVDVPLPECCPHCQGDIEPEPPVSHPS